MSDPSDAPPPSLPIRRSVTLPSKFNTPRKRTSDSFRPSENDLFFHPSAKVVHFAPRAVAPIPSSTAPPSDFDYPVDAVETLPWRSPTERTVAFAPLRLEMVHGLTAFLKCGSVVHAILKNSQCWCVDGESTFVLRIRPLTYYRIELPNESEEDKQSVAAMKQALPKILRYEMTPCPFKRGFTVQIPEEAKAPRPKRAWRPKARRESAPVSSMIPTQEKSPTRPESAPTDLLSIGEDTDGNTTDDSSLFTRASNSTVLDTIPDEKECNETPKPHDSPVAAVSQESLSISPPAEDRNCTDVTEPEDQSKPSPCSLSIPMPKIEEPPRRSVSETPQSFQTLLARFEDSPEPQARPGLPPSSSVESFHSLEPSSPLFKDDSFSNSTSPTSVDAAWQVPSEDHSSQGLSEKPVFQHVDYQGKKAKLEVDSNDRLLPPQQGLPVRSLSEGGSESSRKLSDATSASSRYAASVRSTDSNPNLSSMSVEFRRRSKASREREISPMPHSSALITTSPERHDAASILQKTCTMVLIPPIQLLIVLLHIAARIVIGPPLDTVAAGDLDRKFECQMANPHEAVDDFDIPLAPERRSSVSDAGSKFDPWDLD